ncbi:hypothetical protein C8T65DRAFT_579104 [Cerioporus squamosus]|nr:hypothetical protein C8T65DRAFT_579104 [Cerioporus squamosus]
MENGTDAALSGCGVWFGPADPRNVAALVPGLVQSNQAAEVYAVSLAVAVVPPFAPLHIVTDSRYVHQGLTVHRWEWEDAGWYGLANRVLLEDLVARLRARSAPTTLRWVKGHSADVGNDGADALARLAVEQKLTIAIPAAPRQYIEEGAKLASLSQKLGYRILRSKCTTQDRRAAQLNVELVMNAVDGFSGFRPTAEAVWMGIWRMDCDRQIGTFWWKLLHSAHRIGSYWLNIPGYGVRANCPFCGEIENMVHILCDCPCPWRLQVWSDTMSMLRVRGVQVERLEYAHLIAAGVMRVTDDSSERKERHLETRLFRVLVVEMVYLLWVMRCEWVIGRGGDMNHTFSCPEASERWYWRVNRRLRLDIAHTKPYNKGRAVSAPTVVGTWRGLVENESSLPEDWTSVPGVLVGKRVVYARRGVG